MKKDIIQVYTHKYKHKYLTQLKLVIVKVDDCKKKSF